MTTKSKSKVIVGMSGGVDSAVAALLLKEQNYIVEAVFMKNWEENNNNEDNCPAAQDFKDAKAVCNILQIPLHVVNFSREYWQRVFQFMLDEYAQGRTPNPDVMCNQEIKFKEFINYAKQLNADFIATGHYARHLITLDDTQEDFARDLTRPEEREAELRCSKPKCRGYVHKLYKAIDHSKDQTYFLYTLGQQQLAYTIFPLGELTKNNVRTIAKKNKFPNYNKKDSTGICFIGERKFKKFLSEYLLAKPGDIITTDGAVIGRHDGLMFYTLGQRQGLGIGGKKGAQEAPWYVINKNITQNTLAVAQNSSHPWLMSDNLSCSQVHWIAEQEPSFPLRCTAKVRYHQTEQVCIVSKIENTNVNKKKTEETTKQSSYRVIFQIPQRAITPGQSVVFYGGKNEEECLGGGIIC